MLPSRSLSILVDRAGKKLEFHDFISALSILSASARLSPAAVNFIRHTRDPGSLVGRKKKDQFCDLFRPAYSSKRMGRLRMFEKFLVIRAGHSAAFMEIGNDHPRIHRIYPHTFGCEV